MIAWRYWSSRGAGRPPRFEHVEITEAAGLVAFRRRFQCIIRAGQNILAQDHDRGSRPLEILVALGKLSHQGGGGGGLLCIRSINSFTRGTDVPLIAIPKRQWDRKPNHCGGIILLVDLSRTGAQRDVGNRRGLFRASVASRCAISAPNRANRGLPIICSQECQARRWGECASRSPTADAKRGFNDPHRAGKSLSCRGEVVLRLFEINSSRLNGDIETRLFQIRCFSRLDTLYDRRDMKSFASRTSCSLIATRR